ncbi:MAG: hypothetical protein HY360_17055 [Verrucomicrobia bacterium]|nr:hypothetical protein [Verrucomicrobiota bacterium]
MISRKQVAELVRWYSEFHGAIDPFAPEILKAEKAFFEKLKSLHAAHAADLK